MRLSKVFGNTLREVPAEAEMTSHQLLLRAGMIRQLAAGIYTYLPLGWRVLRKIENVMREEMNAIGGQEMRMPAVHPAELWQETGRYFEAGPVLVRFRDRNQRELVLGITHEEVITDLARREIDSYRQLPFMIYQIQTKFRDEPRSRGGLIRVREFTMKDGYSFHADHDDLDSYYPEVHQAYINIFQRCGAEVLVVEADPGLMGGAASHEFMLVNEAGEDTLIICDGCDYAANAQSAIAKRTEIQKDPQRAPEEVATPDMTTIEEVAGYLGIGPEQTLKAIFYMAGDELVFVAIRGDLEVNETKVANMLGAPELRLAVEEEVSVAGIVAGYASPIGQQGKVKIVADESITLGSNFVAGANKEGYHLRNVNYPRDFEVDLLGDIAAVQEGDFCAHCGGKLRTTRGIELGHIFKLGSKYSEALGARFLDSEGRSLPVVMGCYGIGTGRLMAAVVEQRHDERGIIWPVSIAPYHVHLIALGRSREVVNAADSLYEELLSKGYEIVYDDRDESAGVKFNDADLIGIPLRLTVSSRSLQAGGVEVKRRDAEEYQIIDFDDIEEVIRQMLT
ncbi:MAG: proline--tRNA ligase [Anaerolineae bacterium]|nr:proline--tRNA ligase [Anaerolineae bacterium]NIN99391.1 proline--tRNA ligase [Anaerolineae bacterium]NIQ82256.1 proline--tRNA ligase [Anaerolineae bacterium]